MSNEQINAWDDQWNAEKQALAIGRLEEALRSVLSLIEQGAFAVHPTPKHVQRILDQAKKELETE